MDTTGPDPSTEELIAVAAILTQMRVVFSFQLAALTLFAHDWLTLLDREVEHIWQSKWSIPKILFIISRYGTFIDMPILITINTAPFGAIDYNACTAPSRVTLWSAFLGVFISESILLLRTIAIYTGSKRVAIPLSIVYTGSVVAGIVVNCYFLHKSPTSMAYGLSTNPNVTVDVCYYEQTKTMTWLTFDFWVVLFFELVVVTLTIWRGFRDVFSGTPLLRVVYRDSVGFFLVLLILSLSANIITLLSLGSPLADLMAAFSRVVHSIVCCRILLNLRQAATPRGPSTILKSIALQFVTPEQETNQVETIQFETGGARGDEEDYPQQADEELGQGRS